MRRRVMLERSAEVAAALAAVGLWPTTARAAWPQAAFDAKGFVDAIKALGAGVPQESQDVTLIAPDIAENGAVVPVGCACALPGVKRLVLLVEKNPNTLAAVFEVNEWLEPSFATRVKMAQSSNVYAVALTTDGTAWFAQKEVKVTLGGCGG
ncbi:MAG TPA: thiosulfate oxidation carrier protein SoxY [Burkholderiaceae bacterium]